MQKITPFLWFDTEGEEAAKFYTSIFPNSKIVEIMRYGSAGPRPEGTAMTVAFELDGQKFVALNGGPNFTFNEAISFSVDCADQDEVDSYWEKLTADGGERGPVRVAEGQVRGFVADRPRPPQRAARRPRQGEGAARHGRDAPDEEDRDRRARARRRRSPHGLVQEVGEPSVAEVDPTSAHRHPFAHEEPSLPLPLRHAPVRPDDPVPRNVFVRRGEDVPDQARRALVDVAVGPDEALGDRPDPLEDPRPALCGRVHEAAW